MQAKLNRRGYKSPIPKTAREVVDKSYDDGAKDESSFFAGRKKIGCRVWWDDGDLLCEFGLKDGHKHGNELYFDPDGQLSAVQPFRNGRAHGTAKQFASDGSVLVSYVLRNGVGMDLWCGENGTLAEELYWPDDGELGYQRFWNEDGKTIYFEKSWTNGGSHGIHRRWNDKGKLCRGFPKFFIKNEQVTKKQYLRGCESDPLLPEYRPEQDRPSRTLPAEFLAQRKKKR